MPAPDQIRYEVPGALRNAVRTRRLTVDQASRAIADFLGWDLLTVGDDILVVAAFEQAERFGCPLYDGLYLALAERAACPLVHAGARLRRAVGDRFPQALWLADYVPRRD